MSDKDNGGPAFPCPEGYKWTPEAGTNLMHQSNGMTLRDWFAGQADVRDIVQVGMSKRTLAEQWESLDGMFFCPCTRWEGMGYAARYHAATVYHKYKHADAMLEARNK